jgi:hypothetical protein
MPRRRARRRGRPGRRSDARPESVFLNIPYDSQFENLFLAYISAIISLGFVPRATLEVPFSRRRLDRISDLIGNCRYSLHDLSRVQLDRTAPATPRFNMPFELGLTVGLYKAKERGRAWAVCEARAHRIQKSLSDLNGTDVYIHGGTIQGVFRVCREIFVGSKRRPSVQQMMAVYRVLRIGLGPTLHAAGQDSPFNAPVFRDLCVMASFAADRLIGL